MALVIQFRVENLQDFIFRLVINEYWWQRKLSTVWNRIWSTGFQHGNMENGVDHMHGVR